MVDFFSEVYFGNTVLTYVYFLASIALAVILGKALSWIFANTLTQLTKKTETTLDDFIIAALRKPITVATILIGIYFSFGFLTFDASLLQLKNEGFFVAIIIFVAWLVTKISDAFIDKVLKPITEKTESKLDDHMLPIIAKAVKVIIWSLAAITILGNLGYNVTAILAGLGIGGIAFAFAAQKTIADVFGGVSILFSKPFLIGDSIEVKSLGISGTVEEIGIRNTRIKDADNRLNTVPNSDLSAAVIKNISSEPSRRVVLTLALSHTNTPQKITLARKLITQTIEAHEACKKGPEITALEITPLGMQLQIVYFITDKKQITATQNAVTTALFTQFAQNKILFTQNPLQN